jgi:hypothetical protein
MVEINFEPLFYVMDTQTCRVMAVKSQDKYAMKGLYIIYSVNSLLKENVRWSTRQAYLSNQDISFHPTSFEITKNKNEAFLWAEDHAHLPDNQPFREWADYTPSH